MTLLFIFAFIALLVTTLETTWPVKYKGKIKLPPKYKKK